MIKETIIALIMLNAPKYGIDKDLALAVAEHESQFNTQATSHKGAVGIFQVVPRYHPEYTEKQLRDPKTNIIAGLKILKKFKDSCIHQEDLTWLVCYNAGPTNARKIKYPHKFVYVVAVSKIVERLRTERESFYLKQRVLAEK